MQVDELIEKAATTTGSQNELARRLGQSSGTVSEWKTGRRKCPAHALLEMSRIVGLSHEEAIKLIGQQEAQRKAGKRQMATTLALGVVAMLTIFGASERAQAAGVRGDKCATMFRLSNRRSAWIRFYGATTRALRQLMERPTEKLCKPCGLSPCGA